MNTINLVGRLTNDVELKKTSNDISFAGFTIAVKRPRVKDTTDFIDVVAWRQSAEYVAAYAKKGATVSVSGVLTTRKFEDKSGNKRVAYEVQCDDVSILDSKNTSGGNNDTFVPVANEDDIPF